MISTPLFLQSLQNHFDKQILVTYTGRSIWTDPPPPDLSGSTLESSEEKGTSDSQLHTAFKKTKSQHKWQIKNSPSATS